MILFRVLVVLFRVGDGDIVLPSTGCGRVCVRACAYVWVGVGGRMGRWVSGYFIMTRSDGRNIYVTEALCTRRMTVVADFFVSSSFCRRLTSPLINH